MEKLNTFYMLKPDLIQEPSAFLGATITKDKVHGDNHYTWAIGSKHYLVEALCVVNCFLIRVHMPGLKLVGLVQKLHRND